MRKLTLSFATLACMASLFAAPLYAQNPLTVTGMVENQVCLSKDFVQVTFTAVATSDTQPVGFRWDLNNDNKADTQLSTDPTAVNIFGDESAVTVKVLALNKAGQRAQNTLRFSTLKCR